MSGTGFASSMTTTLFRPGTDTFLLSSLPRLKRGLRVCDLGCGTGLLSLLLLQRQPELQVTGVEILPQAGSSGPPGRRGKPSLRPSDHCGGRSAQPGAAPDAGQL